MCYFSWSEPIACYKAKNQSKLFFFGKEATVGVHAYTRTRARVHAHSQ